MDETDSGRSLPPPDAPADARGAGDQPGRTSLRLARRARLRLSTPARCCSSPISPSTAATSPPITRVSLLFDGGACQSIPRPIRSPQPRLSLLGEAVRCDDRSLLARFTARHPSAAAYAGFGDFHLYRVAIGRGHLVAGFGRISWVEPAALRFAGDGAAWPRPRARDRRAYERGPCRGRGALCRAPRAPARRELADDRHRPRGHRLARATARPRGSTSRHRSGRARPAGARQALIALAAAARERPAV